MNTLITFVILIFSAVVHEVAHGLMAEKFGDSTARDMGRITLNPVPHIDPYGTILLPLFLWYTTGGRFWFGSAKPVPVDFDRLHPRRLGMAMVSFAGPLSNFILAVVFALIIKAGLANSVSYPILIMGIYINILLGVFNLIPIPPLDGSKILVSLAPESWMDTILRFERYGFLLVLLFVFSGLFGVILQPFVSGFWNLFNLDPVFVRAMLG